MDTNNWRPTSQGGEPVMDTGDWRNHLQPDSRQRIVKKITDTLKRRLPFSGLNELKKLAGRFEEKIYTAATSQSDYLRKISLKMLLLESKSQNPMPNSLPSNITGNSNKPPDQAFDERITKREKNTHNKLPLTGWNLMYTNNWRPASQGGEPVMDTGDWRTHLQPDSRQRIVNKITDTLKWHLPFPASNELKKIAGRFEEKKIAGI